MNREKLVKEINAKFAEATEKMPDEVLNGIKDGSLVITMQEGVKGESGGQSSKQSYFGGGGISISF